MTKLDRVIIEIIRLIILVYIGFKLTRYLSGGGKENVMGVVMFFTSTFSAFLNFIYLLFYDSVHGMNLKAYLIKALISSVIIFISPVLFASSLIGNEDFIYAGFRFFYLILGLIFINSVATLIYFKLHKGFHNF